MSNEVPRGNAKHGRTKLNAGLGANDIRLPWKQKEKHTEIRRGKKEVRDKEKSEELNVNGAGKQERLMVSGVSDGQARMSPVLLFEYEIPSPFKSQVFNVQYIQLMVLFQAVTLGDQTPLES